MNSVKYQYVCVQHLPQKCIFSERLTFEQWLTSKVETSVIDLVGTHKLTVLTMDEQLCF
jgi:hypothetical protein